MTSQEKELFARLNFPPFRAWLAAEQKKAIEYLKLAEGITLVRAQGRLALIDELISNLDAASK